MNKETELYLIKRVETLSALYANAEREIERLRHDVYEATQNKKIQAFDVISRFLLIIDNKLTLSVPAIEINGAMKEMFEELLNG